MNRRSAELVQPQELLQGALRVSLQRQGERLLKRYHYPHARQAAIALDRLSGWIAFSRTFSVVPELELGAVQLSSAGLTVEVIQQRCHRLRHRIGAEMLPHLRTLQLALDAAWSLGLVHGDLNRKNILLTAAGYRLVDIEPLVCVPLAGGGVHLRTTPPYLARSDRQQRIITSASDRLGWNCFAAWVRGAVPRPAAAVAQFTEQDQVGSGRSRRNQGGEQRCQRRSAPA